MALQTGADRPRSDHRYRCPLAGTPAILALEPAQSLLTPSLASPHRARLTIGRTCHLDSRTRLARRLRRGIRRGASQRLPRTVQRKSLAGQPLRYTAVARARSRVVGAVGVVAVAALGRRTLWST